MAKTENNETSKPNQIKNQIPNDGKRINLAMEIPSNPLKPKETPKNNK